MPAFCYATRIYRTLTFILQWHFWSFNVSFLKKNVWLFLPLAQDRSCIPATLSMENTAKVLPAWGYSYVGDAFVCVICCILRTSGKWRKKMCINKSYICFTTLQYNIVKSMYNMYSFQNYCQITPPPSPRLWETKRDTMTQGVKHSWFIQHANCLHTWQYFFILQNYAAYNNRGQSLLAFFVCLHKQLLITIATVFSWYLNFLD